MLLNFTNEHLAVLNEALVQMPYFKAAPLITEINKQIQAAFDAAKDQQPPSGAPQS